MIKTTLGKSLLLGAAGCGLLLSGVGIGHKLQSQGLPNFSRSEPLVAQAARTLGVRRCLPAINAVSQRGVAGAGLQDILIDWDRQLPDTGPVYSITGLGAQQQRALLTLVAVPERKGSCSVLVQRVSATKRSCAAVAAADLPSYPSVPLIDGVTVYQNPQSRSETIILVESDGGCMVMRRQASFQWPPVK